jgi:uncharacterized protein DUF6602
MPNKTPKLALAEILRNDADEIIAARKTGRAIYETNDISAAGNQVEEAVRKVLRRKLSQLYYVGHGHIIDWSWKASPQLDVIIADNFGAPSLFKTENETEYFPYESVYAIGEIKTTYYKSQKCIHEFTDKIAKIRSELHREAKQQSDNGWSLSSHMDLPESMYGSSNPLFSFMLFVDSGDFALDDIKELYSKQHYGDLPNVLCFLNKGVLQFKIEGSWATGESWSFDSVHTRLSHETNLIQHSGQSGHWYFNQFGSEENWHGANLGFLIARLSSFLKRCGLGEPDMYKYWASVFEPRESSRIC